MKKGFLMHVFDNGKIEYSKIAAYNAKQINHYSNYPVSLITDDKTFKKMPKECLSSFDKIIIHPIDSDSSDIRNYMDRNNITRAPFINKTRLLSYKLSPYDNTIVIDADYIVQSNSLDKLFNLSSDISISNTVKEIFGVKPETCISPGGIEMIWATVFQFKKSHAAKVFFDILEYVYEHYTYLCKVYRITNTNVFRNDYAFSIAFHLYNGKTHTKYSANLIPYSLLFASEQCSIHEIKTDSIIFSKKEKNILIEVAGSDIHILNKIDLVKHL